jgi:hypothetical protein
VEQFEGSMEGSNHVNSFLGFGVDGDVLISLCDCYHHKHTSLSNVRKFGE